MTAHYSQFNNKTKKYDIKHLNLVKSVTWRKKTNVFENTICKRLIVNKKRISKV